MKIGNTNLVEGYTKLPNIILASTMLIVGIQKILHYI